MRTIPRAWRLASTIVLCSTAALQGQVVGTGVMRRQGRVEGEAVLGPGNVFAAPEFVGSLEVLRSEWPPLPAQLAHADSSPAATAAGDGGSLGALGAPARSVTKITWDLRGARTLAILALRAGEGPSSPMAASLESSLPAQRPQPGMKAGGSWWVVANDATEGEGVSLRQCFGPSQSGWLAIHLEVSARAAVELEVNGGLTVFDAWWNGKKCFTLE